jgi:hypothetical protein
MAEGDFIIPPGRGYLWQQQKNKETDPDFKGDIVLQKDYKKGDKLTMRAYMSKTKKGAPYVSIYETVLQADFVKQAKAESYPREVNIDDDDSVPF